MKVEPKSKFERKSNRNNAMSAYFAKCKEAVVPLYTVFFVRINYRTLRFVPMSSYPRAGDVFACVYYQLDSPYDIISSPTGNIAGYVLIRGIDYRTGRLTVLLPNEKEPLPSMTLVSTGLYLNEFKMK